MTTAYSKFDQLKWLLLDEAGASEGVGVAYGAAKLFLPDYGMDELERIVCVALLVLHEDGLVRFFYASWDDGYCLDAERFPSLSRDEIERELASADVIDAPNTVLFFVETKKGAEHFSRLPPGAVPRTSGKIRR